MNRKTARAILIIFLFLLIAGGGLYSYFRWFRNGSKDLDLETIFIVVDEDISKGYYSEAADTLSACKKFSGNSTVWFRILRRAEAISRALRDYSYLSECAEAAVKDLPGNEELWACGYTDCSGRRNIPRPSPSGINISQKTVSIPDRRSCPAT